MLQSIYPSISAKMERNKDFEKKSSSLPGLLSSTSTRATNLEQIGQKQSFRHSLYPSNVQPHPISNSNSVTSNSMKMSQDTKSNSLRGSQVYAADCVPESNTFANESQFHMQHPGASNPYHYHYPPPTYSSAYNYQKQFSLFPADDETSKHVSAHTESYMPEPLGMDYVNLKKFMEPPKDSLLYTDFMNRSGNNIFDGYDDNERMAADSHPMQHQKQYFMPNFPHESERFHYPVTSEIPAYVMNLNPLHNAISHDISHPCSQTKQNAIEYQVPSSNSMYTAHNTEAYLRPEAMIRVISQLHRKYWRNGRKNLQCFPTCQAYGDYSLIKLEDSKKHDFMWGKCRGSVQIEVSLINTEAFIDDVIVLGRVHSLESVVNSFEEAVDRDSLAGRTIEPNEMEGMKDQWIIGERNSDKIGLKTAVFDFKPKVWKYADNASTKKCKRRHVKYYIQFEAFVLTEDMGHRCYLGIGSGASSAFEVGSSRVLARQKRKAANPSPISTQNSQQSDPTNSETDNSEYSASRFDSKVQQSYVHQVSPAHGLHGAFKIESTSIPGDNMSPVGHYMTSHSQGGLLSNSAYSGIKRKREAQLDDNIAVAVSASR